MRKHRGKNEIIILSYRRDLEGTHERGLEFLKLGARMRAGAVDKVIKIERLGGRPGVKMAFLGERGVLLGLVNPRLEV